MLKAIATKFGIMMNLGVDPASAKRVGFYEPKFWQHSLFLCTNHPI